MITPYNILRHELIGLHALVTKSDHKGYEGISGKIIDETKSTLTLDDSREKKIQKDTVTLRLELPQNVIVDVAGKLLSGRSEDRIKRKIKIKFT